jgi:putative ABC transport system substrate-binding protein
VKRRAFIAAFGGLALWSCPALAQRRPPKTPRIGIVDNAPIWDNFRQGLHEFGYIEGQNIEIEYRSSEGRRTGSPPPRTISPACRWTSS